MQTFGDIYVHDLRLSADGEKLLAIARPDNTASSIVSFDVRTGRQVNQWHVADDYVAQLSVSSDCSRALIEADRRAVLWDLDAGRQLWSLGGRDYRIYRCALSPDGRYALVQPRQDKPSSQHPTILANLTTLWDVSNNRELRTFTVSSQYKAAPRVYPNYNCDHMGFTPDGRRVVTAGEEYMSTLKPKDRTGIIFLWDAASGKLLKTLRGHSQTVTYVGFTSDGRYAVSHARDKTVIVWDVAAERALRTLAAHTTHNEPPVPTRDGKRLVTVSLDGSLRLWDIATGEELVRLIRTNKTDDWLAITPQGLFDGTEQGREQVAFRVGGGLNVVPIDRFFQDFYRPGLLAELARGERPLPAGDFAAKTAPLVKIVSPRQGETVATQRVSLEVEVTDRGGGVEGPWLTQNGARVLAEGERRVAGKVVRRTFVVPLVEGENRLEVRAASGDGSWESEPAAPVLKYEKPLARPALHLVAVGINRYASSTMDLKFARPDAQALADLFDQRVRPCMEREPFM